MFICKLDIDGFRGINSGTILFDKFTVLIGQNNAGKTTIIEALALLFGRDRLVRNLTEHDFFGSNPSRSDRISIIATISGFEPNDPNLQPDWFRMGRGVAKWYDPITGELNAAPATDNDQLACQIAFTARFDYETLEVETIRYFFDGANQIDPFDDNASLTSVPQFLIKQLGFFLVPANRSWDRMMSFGSELFRRVVSYAGGNPSAAVMEERDRLRAPAQVLEEDEKLKALVAEINGDFQKLLGRSTELKLRLTSTDSFGVLEAVIPHYTDGDGVPIPSRRQGSGLISLQTLILLMRFGNLRVANNETFFMAIEEPELHVAPPQQRKLLHLMQSLTTQTIVTTHSPTVAAVSNPHQLVLVSNDEGQLRATPLLKEPLDTSATNLERGLFLSDREATVSAIMYPRLLIPEGKLDLRWFRLFSRLADLGGEDRDANFGHDVGVIPTRDAKVVNTFNLLRDIHPSIVCLVDGDAQGNEYIRQLSRLEKPPGAVIRWPDGWTIETMVAWIIEADPTVLQDEQLEAVGISEDLNDLRTALCQAPLKTDEVSHELLADAIFNSNACMTRMCHILATFADVCAGHAVDGPAVSLSIIDGTALNIWTVQHDISGI